MYPDVYIGSSTCADIQYINHIIIFPLGYTGLQKLGEHCSRIASLRRWFLLLLLAYFCPSGIEKFSREYKILRWLSST